MRGLSCIYEEIKGACDALNSFIAGRFPLCIGETIEAKTHEDVTMLFSDIVGFTSICSTATPMMVINMLQNLYNQFDVYCGQLDVYKVSNKPKLTKKQYRERYKMCDTGITGTSQLKKNNYEGCFTKLPFSTKNRKDVNIEINLYTFRHNHHQGRRISVHELLNTSPMSY